VREVMADVDLSRGS